MRTGTQPTGTREDRTMRHRDWMAAAEEEYRRLGDTPGRARRGGLARGPPTAREWDVREMVAHLVGAAESTASLREMRRQMKLGREPATRRARRRRDQRGAGAGARRRHPGAAARRPGRCRRARGAVAGEACRPCCAPSRCRSARRSAPGRSATLMDRIYTRDAWMHRIDIARATRPRAGPDPRPRRSPRRRRRRRMGAGARAAAPADPDRPGGRHLVRRHGRRGDHSRRDRVLPDRLRTRSRGGPARPRGAVLMSRLVVFSDVLCPWATVVVLRLHAARARAGADDELAIVHRALPLELLLERPVARRIVDAEIPLCASLTPEFGWSLWQGRSEEYPATSLLAAEAIQAASAQSLRAGEQLDLALRRAFFVGSRCISLRHEVLAAAETCPDVDVDAAGRSARRRPVPRNRHGRLPGVARGRDPVQRHGGAARRHRRLQSGDADRLDRRQHAPRDAGADRRRPVGVRPPGGAGPGRPGGVNAPTHRAGLRDNGPMRFLG